MVKAFKSILIRADASTALGTGHIMRMIALAQEWQKQGGEATFVCARITDSLKERIKTEGFVLTCINAEPGSVPDLETTASMIRDLGMGQALHVVLDGYQFNAEFQRGLKNAGCRLLVMDDYGHCGYYHADWVLNQNITAKEDLYQHRSTETQLLLGTRYALLRQEFLKFRGWRREIPDRAKKVLVTLGGSDPDNVTLKVIEALAPLDLEVKVVAGGSNPHLNTLQDYLHRIADRPNRMELLVNPANMPDLMVWADLAVGAGGSTAWELAFMSVPSIYITLANNQKEICIALEQGQIGLSIDPDRENMGIQLPALIRMLISDKSLRERFSANSSKAVDGFGTEMLCSLLT